MNDTNKREPTPAEKAWETAREAAREQGRTVRDEEIRVIKNKMLSCWAKLLFWILTKICWESSPFLHGRRIGSVCITGRQLNLHFNFPQKRLYAQTKRRRAEDGKVVSSRTVSGAIEELETLGVVWMSRKRIENIPANKWPNVFNLSALVPQATQESLGLLEGVYVAEDDIAGTHATNGGSSVFLAQNAGGSGQTPHSGPANPRMPGLAATNGGSGQVPLAGVGKNQRGFLARTNGGSSSATNGGSSQEPTGVAANPRTRELASPASGTPLKTVRPYSDSLDPNAGGPPTADEALESYQKQWAGPPGHPTLVSKLEKELGRIKVKLMNAGPEQKVFWQPRADFIRELLDGGKPPKTSQSSKPVRSMETPAPLSVEKRKELWEAAKKQLPAGMTQPANQRENQNNENLSKRPARKQAKIARV